MVIGAGSLDRGRHNSRAIFNGGFTGEFRRISEFSSHGRISLCRLFVEWGRIDINHRTHGNVSLLILTCRILRRGNGPFQWNRRLRDRCRFSFRRVVRDRFTYWALETRGPGAVGEGAPSIICFLGEFLRMEVTALLVSKFPLVGSSASFTV